MASIKRPGIDADQDRVLAFALCVPSGLWEQVMLGWIVRIIMIVAGVVAGLFVARDAPNFGVVQMMVMLLLLALIVAGFAFWPENWSFKRGRGR
jgi:uncharacterized membrane protein YoaK (UPF0700 family)